ncbi:MAG: histidinol-phosphate transaminase [Bacteroidetes bacterium]|nr:histidinol-phosphate transaminase [Bacteroidota bacterium]
MFELDDNIVRKNILNLKPYSSARDEFSGDDGVFLDANENPFGELNRYPDPYQKELKKKLSEIKSIPSENIFIGNGSDEVIDLTFRIFCNPGKDKALTFSPGYGMYDISAQINDIELIKVPLNQSFQIDFDAVEKCLNDKALKLILVCSPNNPTGNIIDNIELLLQKFKGIVVIDEAYIDFSKTDSFITKIKAFPNLIVSQTFSKAWGLAASRVGTAYASDQVISLFNKVKPPYNVSGLNQKAVLKALKNYSEFEKRKSIILEQKSWVEKQLQGIPVVKKVYHSDSNFILVEVTDSDNVYNKLIRKKVIIRNRNSLVKNCIRITVGTPEENKTLIKELSEL